MSEDLEDAVEQFLTDADGVYGDYEQGYVDADAALSMLQSHIDTLEEAAQE